MIVVAPSSMPPVAMHTRCEESRLSSIRSTRRTVARSGDLVLDAEQLLDARQYAVSLKNGVR